MQAEFGKLYADFADIANTEKVITLWTGKHAINTMTGKETDQWEILMYVVEDDGWEISNSSDREINATWEIDNLVIRKAIKSLFEKGILRV